MSGPRPKIDPLLLAELIESAPGRVRKRLDKAPQAAGEWAWQSTGQGWSIECGEETVSLRSDGGVITARTSVACTCLLSPCCFHVLACVSSLATAEGAGSPSEEGIGGAERPADATPIEILDAAAEDLQEVTDEQRAAARLVRDAVSGLLATGARHAGLLLQSALLRAGHSCRAAGLVQLGNSVLRIVAGVQRLRSGDDAADSEQLVADVAAATEIAQRILTSSAVPQWVLGYARRSFTPIAVRKLEGICAEPVLTLSGYAGICVFLQESHATRGAGKTPRTFTINEVRTGDPQWVHQAYRGGIEMGSASLVAGDICRRSLAVEGMTASQDGRLGKGGATRWVLQEAPASDRFQSGRFAQPLEQQLSEVFAAARRDAAVRPAGWDLIAFDSTVIGPDERGLLVQVGDQKRLWRLRISNDVAELHYRNNLQLLARCPALRMRCVGRVRIGAAGEVDLLAVASPNSVAESRSERIGAAEPPPTLRLPEDWQGLCNVGIDALQRHHLDGVQRWSDEVVLDEEQSTVASTDDGLTVLRRRLVGLVLGGREAIPGVTSPTHQRDLRGLRSHYQFTAAEVLETLAAAATQLRTVALPRGSERAETAMPLVDAFLASAIYTRESTLHFQQACWRHLIDSDQEPFTSRPGEK